MSVTLRKESAQAVIDKRRAELIAAWPTSLRRMLSRWHGDGPDAVWLMYSANYLLRTGGVRWAIDPATLCNLVPEAAPQPVDELARLDLIVLTHGHSDHVDRSLLRHLARFDHIRWITPRHMLGVAEKCGVPTSRTIVPASNEPMNFGPLRLTVFDGLHWEYAEAWGVGAPVAGIDAIACLAEWNGRRALFPGDTRTYDVKALPALGPIDTLFAHVWLGRGAALDAAPPKLGLMCDFARSLSPSQRVLLTHLWQVAREPGDYWDAEHAQMVRSRLVQMLPGVEVMIPDFWTEVSL